MSTPEAPPAEQTITGPVVGVITKSADTWQIAVKTDPASQYSRNLWTKDEEIATRMMRSIGQVFSFYCRVSEWTRQDGQPVKSLWINGWSEGHAQALLAPQMDGDNMSPIADEVARAQQALAEAQARQAAAAQQQAQAGWQSNEPRGSSLADERELHIMREAADARAATILAAMIQTGTMTLEDLTPERMHSFLDTFSNRRLNFYETGQSQYQDEIPF